MGNQPSSPTEGRRSSAKTTESAAERARKIAKDISTSIQSGVRRLEDDNPASQLIDNMCGTFFDEDKLNSRPSSSFAYSEDVSDDGSGTISEDETLDEYDRRRRSGKKDAQSESESLVSQSDYEAEPKKKASSTRRSRRVTSDDSESFVSEDESTTDTTKKKEAIIAMANGVVTETTPDVGLSKPLASSFAKRCYFTKAGIGKTTQHYEGLTLTGNVVLMLAGAMKLKGCPTICDEDLRRVEQTYPNQFSRLPDELLLSSGWRRISKYCHFSNKPVPDGIPFFHSRKRVHPSGGFYFLVAAAVGMIRPIDVEPLTRDTLVLLETDYPTQCDSAPEELIQDPNQWTLVDKFCFFSGGPINTEEDVYYQADFDGNPIYMLAFLSPSLTPEELYKLGIHDDENEPGLTSIAAVEEVESVYDLTDRDFDDLKLYHLGPCRALPPYILQPHAWTKVLPPHFLAARQRALIMAHDYELAHGVTSPGGTSSNGAVMTPEQKEQHHLSPGAPRVPGPHEQGYYNTEWGPGPPPRGHLPPPGCVPYPVGAHGEQAHLPYAGYYPPPDGAPYPPQHQQYPSVGMGVPNGVPPNEYAYYNPQNRLGQYNHSFVEETDKSFQREVEEEGAFMDGSAPIDEAIASRKQSTVAKPPMSPARAHGNIPLSPPGRVSTALHGSPRFDPPDDEPPSLSRRRAADHEGGYQESYNSPVSRTSQSEFDNRGDGHYYRDESGYATGAGRSPNRENIQHEEYYGEEEYYESPNKMSDGEEEYYPREEEYYDSPENPRVQERGYHSRREYYERSPEQQTPTDDFALSPDEVEYYDSPDRPDPKNSRFSPRDGPYYSSQNYSPPKQEVSDRREDFVPIETRRSPSSPPLDESSPQSEVSQGSTLPPSDFSQSSAMRGAQELLKKNRLKRLELAMKKHTDGPASPDDEIGPPRKPSRAQNEDDASAATWESASEITSIVSGSSVWTDASTDRSSRRALILQMAKARMKGNNKIPGQGDDKATASITEAIAEETYDGDDKIGESKADVTADIDFSGDLD